MNKKKTFDKKTEKVKRHVMLGVEGNGWKQKNGREEVSSKCFILLSSNQNINMKMNHFDAVWLTLGVVEITNNFWTPAFDDFDGSVPKLL